MAPRALVSLVDSMVICASPKASCRSVSDFAWEVAKAKSVRCPIRASVIVFRNPYRRLVSGYLNKYVEHTKYREASRKLCPVARLDTFAEFVDELTRHGFRCVDKVHFKPQMSRYRWRRFDKVFNSEELEPLGSFVNSFFETDVAMPFRVRGNRSLEVRGQELAEAAGDGATAVNSAGTAPLWSYGYEYLSTLLTAGDSPAYSGFFNDELRARARRLYRSDFAFLDRARRRGLIDAGQHQRLTLI